MALAIQSSEATACPDAAAKAEFGGYVSSPDHRRRTLDMTSAVVVVGGIIATANRTSVRGTQSRCVSINSLHAGSLCAGLQDLVASTQAETLAAQAIHGAATEAGAALVRARPACGPLQIGLGKAGSKCPDDDDGRPLCLLRCRLGRTSTAGERRSAVRRAHPLPVTHMPSWNVRCRCEALWSCCGWRPRRCSRRSATRRHRRRPARPPGCTPPPRVASRHDTSAFRP